MLQVIAGVIWALVAVFQLSVQNQAAPFLYKSTLFIPGAAAGAVRHTNSPIFEGIHRSKVGTANGAVHTAGSNQFFLHYIKLYDTTITDMVHTAIFKQANFSAVAALYLNGTGVIPRMED